MQVQHTITAANAAINVAMAAVFLQWFRNGKRIAEKAKPQLNPNEALLFEMEYADAMDHRISEQATNLAGMYT